MSSGKESLKPPLPARVIAVLSADTMTTYRTGSAVDQGTALGPKRGCTSSGLLSRRPEGVPLNVDVIWFLSWLSRSAMSCGQDALLVS